MTGVLLLKELYEVVAEHLLQVRVIVVHDREALLIHVQLLQGEGKRQVAPSSITESSLVQQFSPRQMLPVPRGKCHQSVAASPSSLDQSH